MLSDSLIKSLLLKIQKRKNVDKLVILTKRQSPTVIHSKLTTLLVLLKLQHKLNKIKIYECCTFENHYVHVIDVN